MVFILIAIGVAMMRTGKRVRPQNIPSPVPISETSEAPVPSWVPEGQLPVVPSPSPLPEVMPSPRVPNPEITMPLPQASPEMSEEQHSQTKRLQQLMEECRRTNTVPPCAKAADLAEILGNKAVAAEAYEKVCQMGGTDNSTVHACIAVGLRNAGAGLAGKEQSCRAGDVKACLMVAAARHVAGDDEGAKAQLRDLCAKKVWEVCAYLGEIGSQAENKAAAAKCDTGDAVSCIVAAGNEKSDSTAKAGFMFKACMAPLAPACFELGQNAPDSEYLEAPKYCEGGTDAGCVLAAGKAMKSGQTEVAKAYLKKSCDRGFAQACDLLKTEFK